MVQETTAATVSLANDAAELARLVSHFQTEDQREINPVEASTMRPSPPILLVNPPRGRPSKSSDPAADDASAPATAAIDPIRSTAAVRAGVRGEIALHDSATAFSPTISPSSATIFPRSIVRTG